MITFQSFCTSETWAKKQISFYSPRNWDYASKGPTNLKWKWKNIKKSKTVKKEGNHIKQKTQEITSIKETLTLTWK